MEINKARSGVEKKFLDFAEPIVKECGLEIYDLEYHQGGKLLRLFIMDPKTQSAIIDDCVKVDHALSPVFESADWIPSEVTLEVSSPGVYRHLANLNHFEMSLDQTVSITISGELSPEVHSQIPKGIIKQKKFRGTLKSVLENEINLDVEGKTIHIPWEQIKKAIIDPDLESLINQNKNQPLKGGRA